MSWGDECMENYLLQCLHDHKTLTRSCFQKSYNLIEIEKEVELIPSQFITWDHFKKIRDSKHWEYGKFWNRLPETEYRPKLENHSKHLDFSNYCIGKNNYKHKRHELIEILQEVFKDIGIVSTILRFVIPSGFGIFSPPVALILDVRRGKTDINTYENYLDNLEEILERYPSLQTIAKTDMALWALNEHINGEEKVIRNLSIIDSFHEDQFMQSLKARNMAEFFEISDTYLAKKLFGIKSLNALKLSAQIAGIRFEQIVRQHYENEFGKSPPSSDPNLEEKINGLHREKRIDYYKWKAWGSARKTRNFAVHNPKSLKRDFVENLINVVMAEEIKKSKDDT